MADGNDVQEFDFLGTTKVLLGITDNKSDEILQVYITLIRTEILNYCNISELPTALNYVLCQMTADCYRDNNLNRSGQVVGNVSSVSEDGRTVSFGSSADLRTQVVDRVTRTTELNRYRKLYRI